MRGRLVLSQEWMDKILFGKENAPVFSEEFPAKKITTEMNWENLVLNAYTLSQINDIKDRIGATAIPFSPGYGGISIRHDGV